MTATRRVHRLRLTAPRDDLARRGALMLEDALRTASLPDDSRVLVVRTLRIGAFKAGASNVAVSNVVERTVNEMLSGALHALDPSATTASVVYFRDVEESIGALATRIALQRSTSAWFWALAVPAWRPNMSRDEALRALVFASCDTDAGIVGASRLVRTLHEAGGLSPLLSALRVSDVERLLTFSGWSPAESYARERAGGSRVVAPVAVTSAVSHYATHYSSDDPRLIWLACALLVADQPARAMNSDIPRFARSVIAAVSSAGARTGDSMLSDAEHARSPERNARATTRAPAVNTTSLDIAAEAMRTPDEGREAARDLAHAAPPLDATNARRDSRAPRDDTAPGNANVSTAVPRNAADERAVAITQQQPVHDAAPDTQHASNDAHNHITPATRRTLSHEAPKRTQFGGLFLLLTIFTRLDIQAQLTARPELIEAQLPIRLMLYIAHRLGIDDTDAALEPLLAWLGDGDEQPAPNRRELIEWTLRARRWCARHAQLSLRSLAQRPARVSATRTHLDVYFSLAQLDMRVRTVGLDIDPGWLPWLGRVVKFHYGPEEYRGA